jgi:hypothetical protein
MLFSTRCFTYCSLATWAQKAARLNILFLVECVCYCGKLRIDERCGGQRGGVEIKSLFNVLMISSESVSAAIAHSSRTSRTCYR